jgi:hypothetical protein
MRILRFFVSDYYAARSPGGFCGCRVLLSVQPGSGAGPGSGTVAGREFSESEVEIVVRKGAPSRGHASFHNETLLEVRQLPDQRGTGTLALQRVTSHHDAQGGEWHAAGN